MHPHEPEVQEDLATMRYAVALAVVERQYGLHPELAVRYGAAGREKCLQDTLFHLDYLAEAVAVQSASLFVDYVTWATSMLESRGIPRGDFALSLECLQAVLKAKLSDAGYARVGPIVASGRQAVGSTSPQATLVQGSGELDRAAQSYLTALLNRDWNEAGAVVHAALDAGASVQDVYLQIFERTQHEIGRLWQHGQVSVAQEHFSTAATQRIMAELYPRIFDGVPRGRVAVVACVSGELHELGARTVADFLAMDGWDTVYLGASTPAAGIAEVVAAEKADVLALSCILTPHLGAVRATIASVRQAVPSPRVRVLVGGYAFNVDQDLWRRVGADAYAKDAREAVRIAAAKADT